MRQALVGNDIVDIEAPDAPGKEHDRRFLARVFRPEERDLILASPDPNLMLWTLWSAKEAAYKIARKISPETVFAHKRFAVRILEDPKRPMLGIVAFGDLWVNVAWMRGPGYLHCVGVADRSSPDRVFSKVGSIADATSGAALRLSPTELESCHSQESRASRFLAKMILNDRGYHEAEVLRSRPDRPEDTYERWGPPRAWCAGRPVSDVDMSLSHDGRFAAAAVHLPPRNARLNASITG